VEALRPAIRQIVEGLSRYSEFTSLDNGARDRLTDDLVDAVGFAKAGLADILTGKRVKPAAWTMDIFVRDVCDALQKVGVPVPMNSKAWASCAQFVAENVANTAGLPDRGDLFKQMQRAKRITKSRLPDIHISVTIERGEGPVCDEE
jgi:hypothetical protein